MLIAAAVSPASSSASYTVMASAPRWRRLRLMIVSKIERVTRSMTIRISLLVSGKSAEPGVPLGCAPSQTGGGGRHERRLEIAGGGNPGRCRQQQRGQSDEDCDPESSPASPQRPCDQ